MTGEYNRVLHSSTNSFVEVKIERHTGGGLKFI